MLCGNISGSINPDESSMDWDGVLALLDKKPMVPSCAYLPKQLLQAAGELHLSFVGLVVCKTDPYVIIDVLTLHHDKFCIYFPCNL